MQLQLFSDYGTLVSANITDEKYTLEIYSGYGGNNGVKGISAAKEWITSLGPYTDTGYSYLWHVDSPFSTSPTDPNGRYKTRSDNLSSIDVYYDNIDTKLTISNPASGAKVYLTPTGELTTVEAGNTHLLSLARSGAAYYVRLINLPGNIDVVYHYTSAVEKTITVNAGAGNTITKENFPDYYYSASDGTAEMTVISSTFNTYKYTEVLNPFATTVSTSKPIERIDFNVNGTVVSLGSEQLTGEKFLTSELTWSEDSSLTTHILGYNCSSKKITYYNVSTNITIDFVYKNKITFNPNGGELDIASGDNNYLYTNEGKLPSLLNVKTPRISGNILYDFDAWYDGTDVLTANEVTTNTIFTHDDTVYAIWSETELSNITVSNAFNSSGDPVSSASDAFVNEDWANGKAYIEKGYSSVSGAHMTVYTSYGVVDTVTFNIGLTAVSFSKDELISETETRKYYIDSAGNKSETAGGSDVLSVEHAPGASQFEVVLYNVNDDISMTIGYENIKVTYMYNDAVYLQQSVAFNGKAERPADPAVEDLIFDNWYQENTYLNLFDFDTQLKEDTTIYGKYKGIHTLNFIGAGSINNNPISGTNWVADTGGTIDTSGTATVTGDYISASGAAISASTSIGTPDSITFEYNGYTVTLTGQQVTGPTSTTLYLSTTGTVSTVSDPATNVIKYVHNAGAKNVVMRFYRITSDINVKISYTDVSETVTATFDNSSNAATGFTLDVTTPNTAAAEYSFTVLSSDLKGDNNHSVRMAITPNTSLMSGLILSDGVNEYEYRYGDSAASQWYDGIGKVAMAYNSETGKYYVRFLYLLKDVTVKPIVLSEISVSNAFNSSGDPVSSASDAFVNEDWANGKAYIEKGYSSVSGAHMTVYTSYGVVDTVTFNIGLTAVSFSKDELISETETRKYYIDSAGNKSETAGGSDVLSVEHAPGASQFEVVLYNVNDDISMTIGYENIKVTYMYNDAVYLQQSVAFNGKAERPADPAVEDLIFDNWYQENTYLNLFDFDTQLKEDTTIYGKYKGIHTLNFIGAGSINNNPISGTNWVADTGGTIDTSGTATVTGDYISASGAAISASTSIGTPDSITFEYNGYTVTLTGQQVTGPTSTTLYLSTTGTVSTVSDPSTNVIKYVHNAGAENVVMRFYRITSDINVKISYTDVSETVTATFDNSSNAATGFTLDVTTPNTAAAEYSFTVLSSDLKGDNNHSVRMAITPNASLMVGLILSDGVNEYEYRYGDSAASQWYDGIGKVAMAYYEGKYYVRFLHLLKDVTVKPIVVNLSENFTVRLNASEDLAVTYEKDLPSNIGVSDDFRIITVPAGALPTSATNESFRWNLGSTAGSDFEYYKIEIIDENETDENKKILATLGEEFVSYTSSTNQLATYQSPNGISVRYNKSYYGEAQIRFWGVTKNIIIKVYYKNYATDEVVEAENAVFNIKYVVNIDVDSSKVIGSFDYITENTVVSSYSATVPAVELTGDNTILYKNANGINVSKILRVRLSETGKYAIDSVTVSDGIETKTFTVTEIYTGMLGNIVFARNGGLIMIRFNKVYTDKEITITANYSERAAGPYKVVLDSDKNLNAVYDGKNPKRVTVSSNSLNVTIPEGVLRSDRPGESVLWYLSSTAGMAYEYYKIEVYNTDTNELIGTIGAGLTSYKSAAADQTVGAELSGIKIRYNKSVYGEAQIRIWNVFINCKIIVYYKNYATGQEYPANDNNLKFIYKGVVTMNVNNIDVEATSSGPVTFLDNYRKIRFNSYTIDETGVRYVLRPSKDGARIDYVTVSVGGKSYIIGNKTDIFGVSGKILPGAKVRFYRNWDGGIILRIWGVTQNMVVTPHVSYGHKAVITLDIGEHGNFRIVDIPASARINPAVNKITVLQGSTNNSKHGNKTSVRIDVEPKPGFEIDYVTFTVKGQTYKLDSKTLASGSSLMIKIAPGCSVRYNADSNGNVQIRLVHVDEDTLVKVYYRSKTYTVNVNNQKLSKMRAEGYGNSYETEFTENFAVAKVVSGTTVARQNGIKYWIAPIGNHDITGIVVENSYGDYIICGQGFEPAQHYDYKLKGVTLRYYKGHNGMAEIRIWGVSDNINITVFYDGETPVAKTKVPTDILTYDVGEYDYSLPYDNMELSRMAPKPPLPKKEKGGLWLAAGGVVTAAVATAIVIFLKKKKRETE
jgi:ribosome maturation factor RimP